MKSLQSLSRLSGKPFSSFTTAHLTKMASPPMLYMIRHGEKPPKDKDGNDPPGLSAQGVERSQALVQVFGKGSRYNIGLIIAQHPKTGGKEDRPYFTVKPLADSLAPNVKFHSKIESKDVQGVVDYVKAHQDHGNILICWEHHHLYDIAKAFGMTNAQPYPDERFDVIWTVNPPYTEIDGITSEHVQGLDDKYANDP